MYSWDFTPYDPSSVETDTAPKYGAGGKDSAFDVDLTPQYREAIILLTKCLGELSSRASVDDLIGGGFLSQTDRGLLREVRAFINGSAFNKGLSDGWKKRNADKQKKISKEEWERFNF